MAARSGIPPPPPAPPIIPASALRSGIPPAPAPPPAPVPAPAPAPTSPGVLRLPSSARRDFAVVRAAFILLFAGSSLSPDSYASMAAAYSPRENCACLKNGQRSVGSVLNRTHPNREYPLANFGSIPIALSASSTAFSCLPSPPHAAARFE